ncbi:MAG: hypothetical protein ACR2NM_16410 [Bythopirellula sp.]
MTNQSHKLLDDRQLAVMESAFRRGSADASEVLARWIGKPSVIEIASLEQLPLEEATELLADGDEPICFCSAEIQGVLGGELILAFDDASGLALADILADSPQGSFVEWNEFATSAVLETTNIVSCAYLNSLSRCLSDMVDSRELLPTPPKFSRDFAASLLEFALMGQAIASDQVLVTQTKFEVDDAPVRWTLLFVPDAESMARLPELLSSERAEP